MNKVLSFSVIVFALLAVSCGNAEQQAAQQPAPDVGTDSSNFTTVKWVDSVVNFGSVVKGEKVKIKYTCKNTGNKPLFIYYVRPGCGCTVADYTKAAIPPGGTGEVNAEYDSNKGIAGEVRKTITVRTNTVNPSPYLTFFGTVTPNAAMAADSTN